MYNIQFSYQLHCRSNFCSDSRYVSRVHENFNTHFNTRNLLADGSLRVSVSADVAGAANAAEFSNESGSVRPALAESRRHGRHQGLPGE